MKNPNEQRWPSWSLPMAGWRAEKSERVVLELAALAELVAKMPPEQADPFAARLHHALYDALKVAAYCTGALFAWCPEDRDEVITGGTSAARAVLARYDRAARADLASATPAGDA